MGSLSLKTHFQIVFYLKPTITPLVMLKTKNNRTCAVLVAITTRQSLQRGRKLKRCAVTVNVGMAVKQNF